MLIEVLVSRLTLSNSGIKVKINHPETEEEMENFEEIKLNKFLEILEDMIDKNSLKLLINVLKMRM